MFKGARRTTTGETLILSKKVQGAKIRYLTTIKCTRGEPDADSVSEFQILIKPATGQITQMIVRLQRDQNGNCWLNIRANPSSLLNGYNAVGIALRNRKARVERRIILCLPFVILRYLLRELDDSFDWRPETRHRIQNLRFKACPVQVFTYMTLADYLPEQFLGFIRAVLACPIGDGAQNYHLLADLLGVRVESEGMPGSTQTLLLKFMREDRHEISVNLYNKFAKALADSAENGGTIGNAAIQEFLKSSVRVDITMHDPALRRLATEAKISGPGKVALTADLFSRCVRTLNIGEGKSGLPFVQWLLTYVFDDRLPLVRMLRYRPSMVEKARQAIIDEKAVAVFDQWIELGAVLTPCGIAKMRSVSFEKYATTYANKPISRQTARTVRKRALCMGLDLDVPLAAYETVFSMTYHFDLSEKNRREYTLALENGDRKVCWRWQHNQPAGGR